MKCSTASFGQNYGLDELFVEDISGLRLTLLDKTMTDIYIPVPRVLYP